MRDTIFALSSGQPPAGIAVVRISGPNAGNALRALCGSLPEPRHASYRTVRGTDGEPLDNGLALWFPGPGTATGEDLAELHLHGGRAVVAAVLAALGQMERLRPALAGEFTRRAFENGRIDLAEAEGLADLLAAETEAQRQSALMLAEGGLSRLIEGWQSVLLRSSALIEAELDFGDEGDVADTSGAAAKTQIAALLTDIEALLLNPPAERLKDGVRVVLAGPPNSGKSSLFNEIVGRQAAIVTDIAGTTRDKIEAPIFLDGVALMLIDTAGLRDEAGDAVEAMGIALTGEALAAADIILWLGEEGDMPKGALLVAAKADLGEVRRGLAISVKTGEGLGALRSALIDKARSLLPKPDALSLNARHRGILTKVRSELAGAMDSSDLLICAEHFRTARLLLDQITGRAGVEDMLDALFGAFCIGK
jgi:tRNA modification GTPase